MKKETLLRVIIGAAMILVGFLIFFVPAFGISLWLLFIWVPAIFMQYKAFTGVDKGYYVPAGILLTVALVLTLDAIFPAFIDSGGWALFIAAPSVGLFQLYFATGRKDRGLLISASVLAGIVAIFLLLTLAPTVMGLIIGGALLVVGGLIIYRNLRK